ncbi:MAG: PadR family transcriptional regulator [Clostridiales bacterium]|jgi:DNA-binding PadR family transcriptional regulator|uniref:PadR family transcriptional regulator n=1 Tax=Aminipila sp. TaxID=2060095 RepID=UPI001D900B7D|nr:PadR family transcriptional regulator [Aminipila sp.]MBE6034171.1 PadR family transcriptional regulator [Clostridiales bacterium]
MKVDKSLTSGSTTMLILKLLENQDMYGYQMIEELEKKSNNIFTLKAGTLYPILHSLEQQGMITAYEGLSDEGRTRKYYQITEKGKKLFQEKKEEWTTYARAVKEVLGGVSYVIG